jgi:outer membrane receptor protein involved in Fe transport
LISSTLKTAPVTTSLRVSYAGAYWNDQVTPEVPIASWTTLDLALRMPLDRMFPGLHDGSRVEITVDNLLNRDPPYAKNPLVPIGYDPVNANALGRVIGIRFVTLWW